MKFTKKNAKKAKDGDIEMVLDIPKSIITNRKRMYYLASHCSEVNILI